VLLGGEDRRDGPIPARGAGTADARASRPRDREPGHTWQGDREIEAKRPGATSPAPAPARSPAATPGASLVRRCAAPCHFMPGHPKRDPERSGGIVGAAGIWRTLDDYEIFAPTGTYAGVAIDLSRNNATRSQRFAVEAGVSSSRTVGSCTRPRGAGTSSQPHGTTRGDRSVLPSKSAVFPHAAIAWARFFRTR
jgi:hypothetical protein